MALNINIVNSTIIEVYQDSNSPRYYFGALGTSGKFYPSGTVGSITGGSSAGLFEVVSDTTYDLVDNSYSDVPCEISNIDGTPFLISLDVVGGVITVWSPQVNTSGYVIGDTITIQGSDLGGGGQITYKIIKLDIDGLLIVIGGDDYEVKWYDLVIGGTSPTSLQDAQSLLSSLFSTL